MRTRATRGCQRSQRRQRRNSPATKDGKCAGRGGSKFVAANGNTYACNGKEGSPWTAGGTLPPEETETGAWAFGPATGNSIAAGEALFEPYRLPLSFPIPLEASLGPAQVHFLDSTGQEVTGITEDPETEVLTTVKVTSTACLGSAAAPSAEPGHLCVYTAKLAKTGLQTGMFSPLEYAGVYDPSIASGTPGASVTGAQLGIAGVQKASKGWGTWAVTAPGEAPPGN